MKISVTDRREAGHGVRVKLLGCSSLALAAVLPSLACSVPLGKLGDVAEDEGDSDGLGELPPESDRMKVIDLDDGAVDVLFVIDNSGSMGTEQGRATRAIAEFAQVASEVDGADVRIAFTTTDLGNPWCQGTGPESGKLQLSSCTARLNDFVFEGAVSVDATEEACLDLCGLDSVSTIPTTTHLDGEAAPRPWIEAGPDGTNLDGVGLEEAVQCTAPMGISGCGFESPLEAMHEALARAASPAEDGHGFLRPWARLAVVFVTDEADCSVDPAFDEIFLPDGNRVFWGNPDDAAPSSSVCWNAGVECQGGGTDIGPCNPQNYDVDGNVTTAADAVMRSLTRYIGDLQSVQQSKAAYRPSDAVSISLIAGVPEGYLDGTAELQYTRGQFDDPQFISNFGVDPGCSGPAGNAVPPVRLRTIAELFPARDSAVVASVCGDTYSPALSALREAAATPLDELTGCVPQCLADLDADSAGTQPQCDVIISRGSEEGGRIASLVGACGADGAGAGEACYHLRVDGDAAACGPGSNAEVEVEFGEGFDARGHVTVEVACETAPGSC